MVTVKCPLCGKEIEVPEYNSITRSDALVGHITSEHIGKIMPAPPRKGPPLPKILGIEWPWRE